MDEEKSNPTEKELNKEIDKLAVIRIIESGGVKIFGDLVKDIMHQANLGQDF